MRDALALDTGAIAADAVLAELAAADVVRT
jgi:hypothetical protein